MDATEEIMKVNVNEEIKIPSYVDKCFRHSDHHSHSSESWGSKKVPNVELKQLPAGLKYAFLYDNCFPIIVNANLTSEELTLLLIKLRKYRKALGYSLDDIPGISPDLCMHRIRLEDESTSSIQHQRRMNPNLKEVVQKETMKLLDAGIIYPISNSN